MHFEYFLQVICLPFAVVGYIALHNDNSKAFKYYSKYKTYEMGILATWRAYFYVFINDFNAFHIVIYFLLETMANFYFAYIV